MRTTAKILIPQILQKIIKSTVTIHTGNDIGSVLCRSIRIPENIWYFFLHLVITAHCIFNILLRLRLCIHIIHKIFLLIVF